MDTAYYGERLQRAREAMRQAGLDCLVVGPSADLLYLVGARNHPSERMAVLLLPAQGDAHVVIAGFEAPTLPALPGGVQVVTWGESEEPARMAARLIAPGGGAGLRVGVADRLWSVFLMRLQEQLPGTKFEPAGPVLSALRQIKSPVEIDTLARSSALADEVFAEISQQRLSGRTEVDVAKEIASRLESKGIAVEGLPIVASGPNGASPHHYAGDRVIQPGDAVVLDFGGTLDGYFCDITRTVFVGEAPGKGSEQERVYNLVMAAQDAAVLAARPGMTCESLDAVAREMFADAGYGQYFTHRLGHGIGLDGHEPPYLVSGNATALQPGMAFTIEPGLYLPGKFGVRIEDCLIMEEHAARRLNFAPRLLTVVD